MSEEKITLTKVEQNALNWLALFAEKLRNGEAVEYSDTTVAQLARMGIQIDFVNHTRVKKTKRGKGMPFPKMITNAPWYIKGKKTKSFLPFQIRERKETKGR